MTSGEWDSHISAAVPADRLPEALRAGFDRLPIGVLMASAEGAIVLVNRALERLVGYSSGELIGQPIEVLVPEGTRVAHGKLRDAFLSQPHAQAMAAGRDVFARRKDGFEVPVEIELTPLQLGDRTFVLAAITDLSQRAHHHSGANHYDERIAFDALVGDLGAQFLNLRPEEVDRNLEEALGRLVRVLNLDRSALFQLDESTGDFVHSHQWTRSGWPTPPPRVSAQRQFPWHLAQLRAHEQIAFAAVDAVPDAVDRESLRRLGTQSGVTIPLIIDGRAWGALAFSTVSQPRRWTQETLTRLRVVAQIFANVLARKQRDEAVARMLQENAELRDRLRQENAYLQHELGTFVGAPSIVGTSVAMRRVLEQVQQVAVTDAPVLLLGETGSGKTLVAQRIHELSARRERAMVRINCASVAMASADDALFGRDLGSMFSAPSRRMGLLELANGSSVFLDEVTDLPPGTQATLAHIMQAHEMQPPGQPRPVKATFRVIAATSRDAHASAADGLFRNELYYLLNVFPIHVPALRERMEDIPLLVWRFIDEFSARYGKSIDTIEQESMAMLQQHNWPGNARELRNVVERAVIVANSRRLRITMPLSAGRATRGGGTLAAVERAHIVATLAASGGKVNGKDGAAARLGMTSRALHLLMNKLGIRTPR